MRETGTAIPGINMVADIAQEDEDDDDDEADGDDERSLSTSVIEARMVVVRSMMTSSLIPGRNGVLELGQELVDAVDGLDDIGAGRAEDDEEDGRTTSVGGGAMRGVARRRRGRRRSLSCSLGRPPRLKTCPRTGCPPHKPAV